MIGTMVGNYKITEMIGEGGMGAVYKGIDIMLERDVAIKMLRPELARDPNLVERFRSEAITLARLNHPNIATLYSFMRERDDFFMVMEYVRGITLDDKIRRDGAMPVDHATRLFCQALEGIDHAHQLGIVHRDIKPANMMLTGNGAMKVMDFGIARVLGTSRMTKTGYLIGTVDYMSPEQVRGEEADARSDIYALGMLLYEMLTGRLPFNATSDYELMRSQIEEAPQPPTHFAPHIPIDVERAIMRSLAKRSDARFQTAGQFRSALLQLAGSARPQSQVPLQPPPTRLENPAGRPVRSATAPTQPLQSSADPRAGSIHNLTSSPALKETRLAPNQGQYPANPHAHPGSSPGPVGTLAPVGYPVTQAGPSEGAAGSFLDALNWKHYAGTGALLSVLIMVPVVIMLSGSKPAPAPPPQAPPASAPVPQQQAPPAPEASVIDPNAPTIPIPSESSASTPSRPGRRPSTPPADVSGPQPAVRAETPERAAGESRPADSSTPPPAREAAPPSRDQGSSGASASGSETKKNTGEKIGEKVGGAFKKLGGIFGGKKKKDEDKDKR